MFIILGAIIIILILVNIIIYKFLFKRNRLKDFATFRSKVDVEIGDDVYTLEGYVDSGNRIYHKGLPVALVSRQSLDRVMDKSNCDKKSLCISDEKKIKITTISGQISVPIVYAKKIKLYNGTSMNILYNTPVGITEYKFEDFDMLLPPMHNAQCTMHN